MHSDSFKYIMFHFLHAKSIAVRYCSNICTTHTGTLEVHSRTLACQFTFTSYTHACARACAPRKHLTMKYT